MDDRKLDNLIRMALEAESLERSGEVPRLKLVGAPSRRRSWLLPFAAALASAAAAVTVVTVVLPSVSPSVQPIPVAHGPAGTHQPAPKPREGFETQLTASQPVPAEEGSVVLAFFQGIDGRCTCMHIQDEDWDRNKLANKDRAELLDVAYRSTCGGPTPSLLVVAVAGQRDALPRTPEAAEALALKLADHVHSGKSELVNRAYQALPGLPAGSMVVAETVGHRSPVDFAKFSIK